MSRQVTIDLVTHDPKEDEFVLYLVEDEPWPDSGSGWSFRLRAVQDRILSVVDVAVDGLLVAKYPESRGKKIRIQVDSPGGCPPRLAGLVSAIGKFLVEDSMYADAIEDSEDVGGLRVVTGHQMGRFA